MTDMTLIARMLGVMYVCVGLGICISRAHYDTFVRSILRDAGLLYLSGVIALLFGMYIVNAPSATLSGQWAVVSVVGWMALLKGAILLIRPQWMMRVGTWYLESAGGLRAKGVLALLLGAYFLYLGFAVS